MQMCIKQMINTVVAPRRQQETNDKLRKQIHLLVYSKKKK